MSKKDRDDDGYPQVWDFNEWLEKRHELEIEESIRVTWFLEHQNEQKKED